MLIADIIIYTSAVLWLLTPFRQWGGKYFAYFLALALTDPIIIVLSRYFPVYPYQVIVVISLILLFSIAEINVNKVLLGLGSIIIGSLLIYFVSPFKLIIPIVFIHIIILLIIIRIVILTIGKHSRLQLYHCILLLYQLTMVLKFIISISVTKTGILYFYVASAFEIMFAIYFIISKENTSRVVLRLQEAQAEGN